MKIIIYILIYTSLTFASSINIKQNNNIKSIYLKDENILKLLIKFNTDDKIAIADFSNNYSLKKISKLKIGYNIFIKQNKESFFKEEIEAISRDELVNTVRLKYKSKIKLY